MSALLNRRLFNAATLQLAGLYEARDVAPETFSELANAGTLATLPVWAGASDCTIYADARVNHAARAWHDRAHLIGGFAFTLDGETKAAELQVVQLYQAFPSAPAWAAELIRAEVIGQAAELAKTGHFVADQVSFSLAYAGLAL